MKPCGNYKSASNGRSLNRPPAGIEWRPGQRYIKLLIDFASIFYFLFIFYYYTNLNYIQYIKFYFFYFNF